jgi:alpha-2-macroglobulin
VARAIGSARVQMTVRIGDEVDAFEDTIPVQVLVSPETVAAHGEARDTAASVETLTVPGNVVPGYGGLSVELSSTAMVGLGEGARYLVEYPYGCAEQTSVAWPRPPAGRRSRRGVHAAGMDTAKMRPAASPR